MRTRSLTALVAAVLLTAACSDDAGPRAAEPEQRAATERTGATVALASSLPVVWPEAADISDLIADTSAPHWALAVLRERGELRPLDSLVDAQGRLPLPGKVVLVMAQPWPLSPQENVALDDWVRRGGRVLLFADPMLTFDSQYALGDRRRPQPVAMLGPILKRWGLSLVRNDEASRSDFMEIDGVVIPVRLPGAFLVAGGSGCSVQANGLLAECRIGKGRLVALADAALFESREDDAEDTRSAALRALLARLDR